MLTFDPRTVSTEHVQTSNHEQKKTLKGVLLSHAFPDSPLTWWRTREPRTLSRSGTECARLRALIRKRLVPDVDWLDAVSGEATAAIAVAIRQMDSRSIGDWEIDLALSAVLACALEGDATAPIVLSSALRRRSKIDPACHRLVDPWLRARFSRSSNASGN
jgi:hypothetical protein